MNFFYYYIYDRFIHRQPCACVHVFINFFFKKLLLRNYGLDFYQISQECSLDRGYKLPFTVTEKSGLWSDTGAQVPLVMCLLYRSFENTVEKQEIARNKQFLLFPPCFLP